MRVPGILTLTLALNVDRARRQTMVNVIAKYGRVQPGRGRECCMYAYSRLDPCVCFD